MIDQKLKWSLGMILLPLAACGPKSSTRLVDDPTGTAVEYGAPRETAYVAELDAAREEARVTVYEVSRCEMIPVTVVQTYEERLRGDEVVQRNPVSKKQVTGPSKGDTACGQTYARNVEVMLAAGNGRYSLGKTDARGQVSGQLAQIFKVGSFAEVPAEVKVLLRPPQARPTVDAGTLTMTELIRHEERVRQLLGELEQILAKGASGASPGEITRSYELYAELQDIAGGDPRVMGISTRFWELYVGRKQEENIARMGMTLDALGQAKETLKMMGDAAIPIYVQAAVNAGTLDQRALEWSSLRLIRAIKGTPSVCVNGFSWGNVPSYGWPADARLAAQYTRYGYGDAYAATMQNVCRY